MQVVNAQQDVGICVKDLAGERKTVLLMSGVLQVGFCHAI